MDKNRARYIEQQIRDLRKRLARLSRLAITAYESTEGENAAPSVFDGVDPVVSPWTHLGGWGGLVFTSEDDDTAPVHPVDPHSSLGIADKPHTIIRHRFADEAERLAWTPSCANLRGSAVWQTDTNKIYLVIDATSTPVQFLLLNPDPSALWTLAGTAAGTATHTLTVTDNSTNQRIYTPMRVVAHYESSDWQINVVKEYSSGGVTLLGDGVTTGDHTFYYCHLPAATLERGYGHARPPDGYVFPAPALLPVDMQILAASAWAAQSGTGTKIKLWLTDDCDLATVIASGGDALHTGSGFDGGGFNLWQAVSSAQAEQTAGRLLWTEVDTAGGAGFITIQIVYVPDFISEVLDV